MKIIDLLNKIANGEIKDKQKFRVIYQYSNLHRDFYYDENEGSFLNSLKNISDDYVIYDEVSLNDEIEIIEEPKMIEKIAEIEVLGACDNWIYDKYKKQASEYELNSYILETINKNTINLQFKIDEIIDRLNEVDGNE